MLRRNLRLADIYGVLRSAKVKHRQLFYAQPVNRNALFHQGVQPWPRNDWRH